MNRSTTRSEYKAFMRKWRSALANVSLPDDYWKRQRDVQQEGRDIAFGAVYDAIPSDFWRFSHGLLRHSPQAPSKKYTAFAIFNLKHCANSYPHKTRNP